MPSISSIVVNGTDRASTMIFGAPPLFLSHEALEEMVSSDMVEKAELLQYTHYISWLLRLMPPPHFDCPPLLSRIDDQKRPSHISIIEEQKGQRPQPERGRA